MKKTTTTPTDAAPAVAADQSPSAVYEVLADQVHFRSVIAYRTARLTMTAEEAEKLNTFQPGAVKFLGI